MIAFVSLFLGLVFGVRPVEVVVGDAVAAVELRLDGESLGMLREAPWTMRCDFGEELTPQHLEAVSFDAAGRELGRASQWLNLPQARAVANVVLEPRVEGEPRVARLSWESAAGAEPESVTIRLDGQPLSFTDPRRVELPPVDESQLHLLQVEMRFEGRVAPRVDFTFGGSYADEVSTAITALALLADDKLRRPLTAADVEGWFLKDGEALEVLAVEKETSEIVVVMGRPFPYMVEPGRRYKAPKSLFLAEDEKLRFLSTVPEESRGVATTFELFPISRPFGGSYGDLHEMLSRVLRPPQNRESRPTAAVAVAGLSAYEGRHRRAVVLIPRERPPAEEALQPAGVRRYLDRLGVPLFVWDPELRPARHLAAWGEVRTVGSLEELTAAFAEVSDHLARQWVVWLAGRHRPQDVTLAPVAEGVTLLAREP